ncbi:MAG TPA: rhodanese-related sulfurtransferase [Chitinophagales bacterium]|nr:rhodanese-related sulfurtransferase [Chitinophagales bacterium]
MHKERRLLHNIYDGRVLKQRMLESNEKRITLSFYKYWRIKNPSELRDKLFLAWSALGVMGRVYVAKEGINAQLSVPEKNLNLFRQQFEQTSGDLQWPNGIRLNYAADNNGKSFFKLKIKVRDKILADGLNDETFDVTDVGKHLSAEEFNRLTDHPDTILIDMRNHYESEVGHFEGAILPDADTFRDELKMVEGMLQGNEDKNIVMYCTGGIRCEKASAWLKHKGFRKVYQLEGGIISYARQVKEQGLKNKFHGKNFVFDERLGERITEEVISRCHQCGNPSDRHTNCANEGCHLLFIQCDECAGRFENCCSEKCREFIHLPQEQQQELRKGVKKGRNVFRKGRMPAFHH